MNECFAEIEEVYILVVFVDLVVLRCLFDHLARDTSGKGVSVVADDPLSLGCPKDFEDGLG
jgi:hypothetical protein